MNLPNKLTILRTLMVPLMVFFLLWDLVPYHYIWALAVFILASLTDAVDGHIARKHHLVTNLGKFLDPLADKVLVISALICLLQLGSLGEVWGAVYIIVILAREFMVTSMRLVASSNGRVVAASIWGKAKTVSQMLFIIADMLLISISEYVMDTTLTPVLLGLALLVMALEVLSLLLTIISGVDYIWKNRDVFRQKP